MHRTQIQLTKDQLRALKKLAAERGQSMADLIRRAVDRLVREAGERKRRALAAAGRFRSGIANLSADHDRHLDEAFGDDGVR